MKTLLILLALSSPALANNEFAEEFDVSKEVRGSADCTLVGENAPIDVRQDSGTVTYLPSNVRWCTFNGEYPNPVFEDAQQ